MMRDLLLNSDAKVFPAREVRVRGGDDGREEGSEESVMGERNAPNSTAVVPRLSDIKNRGSLALSLST